MGPGVARMRVSGWNWAYDGRSPSTPHVRSGSAGMLRAISKVPTVWLPFRTAAGEVDGQVEQLGTQLGDLRIPVAQLLGQLVQHVVHLGHPVATQHLVETQLDQRLRLDAAPRERLERLGCDGFRHPRHAGAHDERGGGQPERQHTEDDEHEDHWRASRISSTAWTGSSVRCTRSRSALAMVPCSTSVARSQSISGAQNSPPMRTIGKWVTL